MPLTMPAPVSRCGSFQAHGGIGAPTGDAQDREPFQPEGLGYLADIVRPVDNRAAGLEVRQAHARLVERDHPDTTGLAAWSHHRPPARDPGQPWK